jgi:hypothetical protein
MPGIALKNFRGFQKTFIPLLRGANFFVGENSTGKTSVLSLIEILSSYQFYFSHDLISEYADFTAYENAVSARTPRADLGIGYFRLSYSKLKRGTIDALSFHFANDKGQTELKSVQYLANGFLIEAVFRRSLVQYEVHKAVLDPVKHEFPMAAAEQLLDNNGRDLRGALVTSGKYSYASLPMPSPLISILNVLALEKLRHSKDDPYVKASVRPELFDDLKWIAPIRAKPQEISTKVQSTYSAEGEHIPSMIRKAFGSKPNQNLANRLNSVITPFGQDSHLFDGIGVQEYGAGPTSPYEVQIRLGDHSHRLSNVGYGVSQSLPVLIEIAAADSGESFIVQQPEVHLHPKAQASFGEFLHNSAISRKHTFYIETHSDYLIDRYRLQMRLAPRRAHPPSQILFFKRSKKGLNTAIPIRFNKDGSYPDNLPADYREFFLHEELKLLSVR